MVIDNDTIADPDIAALMRGEFLVPLPDVSSETPQTQLQSTSAMQLDQPPSLPKKPASLPDADAPVQERSSSTAPEAMTLPSFSAPPPRPPPTGPKSLTQKHAYAQSAALRAELAHLTTALARAEAQLQLKEQERSQPQPQPRSSPSSSRTQRVEYWDDKAADERNQRKRCERRQDSLERALDIVERAYEGELDLQDQLKEEMKRANRRATWESKQLAAGGSAAGNAPKSRRVDGKKVDVDLIMTSDEKVKLGKLEKEVEDLTAGLVALDAQLTAEAEAEAKLVQERGRVKAEIVALKFRLEAHSKMMTPGLREALSILDKVSDSIALRVAGQSGLRLDTQEESLSGGSLLPLKRTFDVAVE